MADHDEASVIHRLRAQVEAVEKLAAMWQRSKVVPKGFRPGREHRRGDRYGAA